MSVVPVAGEPIADLRKLKSHRRKNIIPQAAGLVRKTASPETCRRFSRRQLVSNAEECTNLAVCPSDGRDLCAIPVCYQLFHNIPRCDPASARAIVTTRMCWSCDTQQVDWCKGVVANHKQTQDDSVQRSWLTGEHAQLVVFHVSILYLMLSTSCSTRTNSIALSVQLMPRLSRLRRHIRRGAHARSDEGPPSWLRVDARTLMWAAGLVFLLGFSAFGLVRYRRTQRGLRAAWTTGGASSNGEVDTKPGSRFSSAVLCGSSLVYNADSSFIPHDPAKPRLDPNTHALYG